MASRVTNGKQSASRAAVDNKSRSAAGGVRKDTPPPAGERSSTNNRRRGSQEPAVEEASKAEAHVTEGVAWHTASAGRSFKDIIKASSKSAVPVTQTKQLEQPVFEEPPLPSVVEVDTRQSKQRKPKDKPLKSKEVAQTPAAVAPLATDTVQADEEDKLALGSAPIAAPAPVSSSPAKPVDEPAPAQHYWHQNFPPAPPVPMTMMWADAHTTPTHSPSKPSVIAAELGAHVPVAIDAPVEDVKAQKRGWGTRNGVAYNSAVTLVTLPPSVKAGLGVAHSITFGATDDHVSPSKQKLRRSDPPSPTKEQLQEIEADLERRRLALQQQEHAIAQRETHLEHLEQRLNLRQSELQKDEERFRIERQMLGQQQAQIREQQKALEKEEERVRAEKEALAAQQLQWRQEQQQHAAAEVALAAGSAVGRPSEREIVAQHNARAPNMDAGWGGGGAGRGIGRGGPHGGPARHAAPQGQDFGEEDYGYDEAYENFANWNYAMNWPRGSAPWMYPQEYPRMSQPRRPGTAGGGNPAMRRPPSGAANNVGQRMPFPGFPPMNPMYGGGWRGGAGGNYPAGGASYFPRGEAGYGGADATSWSS